MLSKHECDSILKSLMPAFPLPGWDITVHMRYIPDENGETISSRMLFDSALRRAIISVDPRYPKEDEFFSVREILAHELGHIVLTENLELEHASTAIGCLLIQLADAKI